MSQKWHLSWFAVLCVSAPGASALGWIIFRDGAPQPASSASQPASAAVIDEDLVKKLLGGESSAVDAVESMLDNMERATQRLSEEHDAGNETQKIQSRIVAQLDDMIKQASQGGGSQSGRKARQKGRRSARPQDARPGPPRPGDGSKASPDAPQIGPELRGDAEGEGAGPTDRMDLSRRWGFLPEQERAEVAQGFDESYLPRFREHIRRYYLRLAAEGQREEHP